DIIKAIFTEYAGDVDDAGLHESYREWEYCVQYRETDFNFVSRLMEQEGIYYFSKHEDGKHTLMLCDGPLAHQPLDGFAQLPFHHPDGRALANTVSSWRMDAELQTGGVGLK